MAFFIVLVALSVMYPFVGIGSVFIGVIIMLLFPSYFTTTPFIVAVSFPATALIIAGFGAIWGSKR